VSFHTLHRRIDAHHLRLMTMLQKWKDDVETVATDNGLFTLTRTVRVSHGVTCLEALDGFLYCLESNVCCAHGWYRRVRVGNPSLGCCARVV